jgi:hypothetical protein
MSLEYDASRFDERYYEHEKTRDAMLASLCAVGSLCEFAQGARRNASEVSDKEQEESLKRRAEWAQEALPQLRAGLMGLSQSEVRSDWESTTAWKAVTEIWEKMHNIDNIKGLKWREKWQGMQPDLRRWARRYNVEQLINLANDHLSQFAGLIDPRPTLPPPPNDARQNKGTDAARDQGGAGQGEGSKRNKSKGNRGRPKGSQTRKDDLKLWGDYQAAHNTTGVSKPEFIRNRGLDAEEGLAALDRGRKAPQPPQ